MKYQLTDYQGRELTITSEQAINIAEVAGLIEVEISGQKHYLNKSNIASIVPTNQPTVTDAPQLARGMDKKDMPLGDGYAKAKEIRDELADRFTA
jgi:hypothetical protein